MIYYNFFKLIYIYLFKRYLKIRKRNINRMELSEDYLDKMLNFAIKYHGNEPTELKKIPNNFNNLDNALEYFQNALEFETHSSLKEKSKITDDPTLYTVNLDSDEPGIILGKKSIENNTLELKERSTGNVQVINVDVFLKQLHNG